MRSRLHPEADAELGAAVRWYQNDYPGRGWRFYDAVTDELARIREAPLSFPFWRRRSDVRACVGEAWEAEIERRIADQQAGRGQTFTLDEIQADVRANFGW